VDNRCSFGTSAEGQEVRYGIHARKKIKFGENTRLAENLSWLSLVESHFPKGRSCSFTKVI
jgi:hypothetical protein